MALGASAPNVLRLVVGGNLAFVAAGVPIGIVGAIALARGVTAFLHGVPPADPATLIGTSVALVVVAALAAIIPGRRAVRIDPLIALRAEN
jgi:putative ABC transport system permease protein